ncbi:MAG: leucine-rich repeat protein, partial [Lachnospiraceae bacterium]|nr:leucine-rich repeat protein [Lachnospiraceae bacterium]
MTEMIILFVASKERIDMLDRMVQMFNCVDLCIVPFAECFAVLISAIFCNLGSIEQCADRKQVKPVRRVRLLTAVFVFDNRRIRRLTLPRGQKSIGDYAFLNLREMEELCLFDELQGVGGACFMNCRSFSRLDLTRSSPQQGPALAAIVSALPQELSVLVHGGAEGELRLVFPEYVERYEENSPARHFDFKIGGAGYP